MELHGYVLRLWLSKLETRTCVHLTCYIQAIPGSHLWSGDRAPKKSEVGYATMVPGEAVCYLGGIYHAGGANVTKDQKRALHSMHFTRGYLRTEVS